MDSPSAPTRALPAAHGLELRPAVALATSALVVLAVARFEWSGRALAAVFLLCVVAVVTVIDLEQRRIPNRIVLPATAVAFATQLAVDPGRAPEVAATMVGAGLFFAIPMLASPRGMGMGDVKLAVFLGAVLGTAVMLAIAVAVFAAFPVALAMLVRQGADARKHAIPFGPFLAVGAVVAIFLG